MQCVWHKKNHEMHVENFGHCVFHTMSACLPNWIFPQLLFFPLHPAFPPLLRQNFQEKWVRPFFCVIVFSIADKFPLFDFGFSGFEDFLARDFPQLSLTHLVTWCWLPPLLNGLKIGWKARKQFLTSFPRPLVHQLIQITIVGPRNCPRCKILSSSYQTTIPFLSDPRFLNFKFGNSAGSLTCESDWMREVLGRHFTLDVYVMCTRPPELTAVSAAVVWENFEECLYNQRRLHQRNQWFRLRVKFIKHPAWQKDGMLSGTELEKGKFIRNIQEIRICFFFFRYIQVAWVLRKIYSSLC